MFHNKHALAPDCNSQACHVCILYVWPHVLYVAGTKLYMWWHHEWSLKCQHTTPLARWWRRGTHCVADQFLATAYIPGESIVSHVGIITILCIACRLASRAQYTTLHPLLLICPLGKLISNTEWLWSHSGLVSWWVSSILMCTPCPQIVVVYSFSKWQTCLTRDCRTMFEYWNSTLIQTTRSFIQAVVLMELQDPNLHPAYYNPYYNPYYNINSNYSFVGGCFDQTVVHIELHIPISIQTII